MISCPLRSRWGAVLLVLTTALVGLSAVPVLAQRTPNIVVILVDDAGYADFGFTGCTDFATPNIDRLAADGVVFSRGYVSASVCSPSRAGFITGRYQQRFGHECNLGSGGPGVVVGLPLTELTIADHLQARGYVTGIGGKWHLGAEPGYHPLDRGFDEFFGMLSGSRSYFAVEPGGPATRGLMRDRELIDEPEGLYLTDALGEYGADFIRRHTERPFFLYLSFNAVHTPMHAKPEDLAAVGEIGSPKRRKLAAMTIALDRAVGTVVSALDDAGVASNTMVFFLNDNGGATTNASDNGVLRGMKGSKWEGGVRVPYVLRWPGVVSAGSSFADPVSSLDIAATALGAVGGPIPGSAQLDGVDLRPHLAGKTDKPPHARLFWRRAVAASVLEGDWKLVRVDGRAPMLFNLATHPGEDVEVTEQHPEVAARLLAALVGWESEMIEPLWTEGERWENNQRRKHEPDLLGRDAEREIP